MKKICALISVLLLLCICAAPALAAGGKNENVKVEITSPASIDSVPVHDDSIQVAVTNTGREALKDLACYLTIVDMGRGQTYPVDEFGENAYQTRNIASLAPGEKTVVTIPVRVMYVGRFHFTASVMDYKTNQVFSSDAVNVTMSATSDLNKTLVMAVSGAVPAVLAAAAVLLTKGKTKGRE